MKKMATCLALCALGALSAQHLQAQNVLINMVTQQAGVNDGIWDMTTTDGSILITVCNTDGGNTAIAANRIRPFLSTPNQSVMIAPNAMQTIPPGWTIVSNNGQTIRFSNGTDVIAASDCREWSVVLQPKAVSNPFNMHQLAGVSIAFNGPSTPGDNPADNNSQSSITVIAVPPVAVNDNIIPPFPAGQPAVINILSNDQSHKTGPAAQATPANVTVDMDPNTAGTQTSITTTGTGGGSWVYNPATGQVTFTPTDPAFTGTPIAPTYIISEAYPHSDINGPLPDVPVLSSPASINITYTQVLPITLESFTGRLSNCSSSVLEWKVNNAENFNRFELQRSQEGQAFKSITTIPSDRKQQSSYSYKESDVAAGRYLYRLRMIDNDESFKYSDILTLRYECETTGIKIYPNPTSGTLSISGLQENDMIQLYNVSGQLLNRKKTREQLEQLDLSSYSPGIYLIRILRNGKVVQESKIVRAD